MSLGVVVLDQQQIVRIVKWLFGIVLVRLRKMDERECLERNAFRFQTWVALSATEKDLERGAGRKIQ